MYSGVQKEIQKNFNNVANQFQAPQKNCSCFTDIHTMYMYKSLTTFYKI